MPEETSSISLKVTDERIERWCKQAFGEDKADEAYILLAATWRRLAAGVPGIQMADLIYTVYQAKQNGLPAFGEFYSLIPRPEGKGFSLCFRLDAAYFIITHHPSVVPGSVTWQWTTSDGKVHDKDHPPQFARASDIDYGMTCTVSAKLKDAEAPCTFTCAFREWVSMGKEGIKYMWGKSPVHMLFKQTVKEWTRVHLGSAMPFEDQVGDAVEVVYDKDTMAFPASVPAAQLPSGTSRSPLDGATWTGFKEDNRAAAQTGSPVQSPTSGNGAAPGPIESNATSAAPEVLPPLPAEVGVIEKMNQKRRQGTKAPGPGEDKNKGRYMNLVMGGLLYQCWDTKYFDLLIDATKFGKKIKVSFKAVPATEGKPEFRKVESVELYVEQPIPAPAGFTEEQEMALRKVGEALKIQNLETLRPVLAEILAKGGTHIDFIRQCMPSTENRSASVQEPEDVADPEPADEPGEA